MPRSTPNASIAEQDVKEVLADLFRARQGVGVTVASKRAANSEAEVLVDHDKELAALQGGFGCEHMHELDKELTLIIGHRVNATTYETIEQERWLAPTEPATLDTAQTFYERPCT